MLLQISKHVLVRFRKHCFFLYNFWMISCVLRWGECVAPPLIRRMSASSFSWAFLRVQNNQVLDDDVLPSIGFAPSVWINTPLSMMHPFHWFGLTVTEQSRDIQARRLSQTTNVVVRSILLQQASFRNRDILTQDGKDHLEFRFQKSTCIQMTNSRQLPSLFSMKIPTVSTLSSESDHRCWTSATILSNFQKYWEHRLLEMMFYEVSWCRMSSLMFPDTWFIFKTIDYLLFLMDFSCSQVRIVGHDLLWCQVLSSRGQVS